jgi:cell pole-organizing protein PopZ
MEEILASIRRIISEDDAPPAEAAAPPPPPEPEPAPAPPAPVAVAPPPHEDDEDVLELTEPVHGPAETHGDIDVFAPSPEPEPIAPPPAPVAAASPAYKPTFAPEPEDDGLVSGGIQERAAMHFGKLSQSIAMPDMGRTLEDVVRELLRPLLKEWLDENLPGIVEEKVQAEVERISRRRV